MRLIQTCRCGATMEAETDGQYNSSLPWVSLQNDFLQSHEKCPPSSRLPAAEPPAEVSPERSATTEASTKDALSDAAASTGAPMSRWQLLLGALSAEESFHVRQCSECWGLLEKFESVLLTHVQDAAIPDMTEPEISTSANPDSSPSAETSAEDVATSSSPSSEVDWRQEYEDAFSKGYEQGVADALAKAELLAHPVQEPELPPRPQLYDIKRAPGIVEVDNSKQIKVDLEDEPEPESLPEADLEPEPENLEPVATAEAVCGCPDSHWQKVERFNARVANEAHIEHCPLYRKGAHFFPLVDPRSTDGSGVYVSKCIWCGETKEMRPYEGTSPLAAKGKEMGAKRKAQAQPEPKPVPSPAGVSKGYQTIDTLTEAEQQARKNKLCIDCGTETSGWSPRCRGCGQKRRTELMKEVVV